MNDFNLEDTKNRSFSLFRNFIYSKNGFLEVLKNEKPMQAEMVLLSIGTIIIIFLDLNIANKLILFASLLFPIFAELGNSAIERVVDLVTTKHHELAKNAKDAGSAMVLVSLIITGLIWCSVLISAYM